MSENRRDSAVWLGRLYELVHRHWQYHAPCAHVNMQGAWDEDHGSWRVKAAPVFQEVLGGVDDGKKVWAGFLFEAGAFGRSAGVHVEEQAVASCCNDCRPYPELLVKGTFEGRPFVLHVYLEPAADSEVVEVIDALRGEVREKRAANPT